MPEFFKETEIWGLQGSQVSESWVWGLMPLCGTLGSPGLRGLAWCPGGASPGAVEV